MCSVKALTNSGEMHMQNYKGYARHMKNKNTSKELRIISFAFSDIFSFFLLFRQDRDASYVNIYRITKLDLHSIIPHSHQKLSCLKSGVSYSSTVSSPTDQE